MSFGEQIKKGTESVTGIGRPSTDDLPRLVKHRDPQPYQFEDDGKTPNNPRLPLLHYRDVLTCPQGLDSAAICEELFAAHGWKHSWRNGIYGFLHFHTGTHEVLGIARGEARVQFGGDKGKTLTVQAGDVVVLPAGTGHRRISASDDLLVVGAYPAMDSSYDQPAPNDVDHRRAVERIAKVPAPDQDPLYGPDGPLTKFWAARNC